MRFFQDNFIAIYFIIASFIFGVYVGGEVRVYQFNKVVVQYFRSINKCHDFIVGKNDKI